MSGLTNVGRDELIRIIDEHVTERGGLRRAILELQLELDARNKQITELQADNTRLVYERRAVNGLEELQFRIGHASQKHPSGPGRDLRSLAEEIGEVAKAIRHEGTERVRDELLDVACVAMRMRDAW